MTTKKDKIIVNAELEAKKIIEEANKEREKILAEVKEGKTELQKMLDETKALLLKANQKANVSDKEDNKVIKVKPKVFNKGISFDKKIHIISNEVKGNRTYSLTFHMPNESNPKRLVNGFLILNPGTCFVSGDLDATVLKQIDEHPKLELKGSFESYSMIPPNKFKSCLSDCYEMDIIKKIKKYEKDTLNRKVVIQACEKQITVIEKQISQKSK